MNDYDRALLWYAIEGTYLIELRDGADDLPSTDVANHREQLGAGLLRLIDAGLASGYLAPWVDADEITETPLTPAQVRESLTSGSAWDPEREQLVAFEATDKGRLTLLPA